uniref:Golgi apparatus membrane protein TVP23 homolog n=1 Tax=Plectus sambesii TaxID=2011161 RepID=A0A914WHA2_9BILA
MAANFDASMSFGEEHAPPRLFKNPLVVGSHLVFRSAAIMTYMFSFTITDSFIIQFLTIIFLLSIDFWTVKNVTGRLLVGMRWWNFVDNDGNNHWKFETRQDQSKIHPMEARVFWLALVLCPLIWAALIFMAFFTLKWEYMVIPIMGTCMSGANLYGYLCCKWSSRQDLTNYLSKTFLYNMMTRAGSYANQTTA